MSPRDPGRDAATGAHLLGRVTDFLGPSLTAYAVGAPDTATVRDWASGAVPVDATVAARLRIALDAAVVIAANDAPQTAEAWFQSHVEALGGRSPARVLREGDPARVGPAIVAAARAAVDPAGR